MTERQKENINEATEMLNKIMKLWIARNDDGSLWMFDDKPIKIENFWGVNHESEKYTQPKPAKRLYDWYFPEITFDNSPQQVEISLAKGE